MALNRNNILVRANIIQSIRDFFNAQGFLEVETPLRIPANAPEEFIDPCPSAELYLQTSPEICMKRLLCQGHEKIYQICKCWRAGERGSRHIPEFTMLEWYRAGSGYNALMNDCEALLLHVCRSLGSPDSITFGHLPIIFDNGLIHITVREAFDRFCLISMEEAVHTDRFDELMVTAIEPALHQNKPVILKDYPIQMAALARQKTGDPGVAERFELYAGGMELANGFSELNDADEQRSRFEHANYKRMAAGMSPLPLPEPFLRELSLMPPSAGIALGIDRLVMLFTDSNRIDDVVTFTPEQL
jgi:lysyl-tRNA synthetase class 2